MAEAWSQFAEGGLWSFLTLLVGLAANPIALVAFILTCVLAARNTTTRAIAVSALLLSSVIALVGFVVSGTLILIVTTPALLLGVASVWVNHVRAQAALKQLFAEV